jgi:hypothetical protein
LWVGTHAVESKFTSVILAIKSAGQFELAIKGGEKFWEKRKSKKTGKRKP